MNVDFIINELDRGVTFIKGTGGYSNEEKKIILTIIDRKQVVALKKGVNKIDPSSFVSISHTYETLGEGFTLEQNMNKELKKNLEQEVRDDVPLTTSSRNCEEYKETKYIDISGD